MTTVFNVSNSGSGAYIINSVSNPTLNLIRGTTYTFSMNASGHPFWIQTTATPYNASNVYNSGVTNNGAEVGTITFIVPLDAPNTLYYICQYHTSMRGTINITDVVCYAKNTLILTNKGYVPIQYIKDGDKVLTKGQIHEDKYIQPNANTKEESVL